MCGDQCTYLWVIAVAFCSTSSSLLRRVVPCSDSCGKNRWNSNSSPPFLVLMLSGLVDVCMRAGGLQSSIKSQSYALTTKRTFHTFVVVAPSLAAVSIQRPHTQSPLLPDSFLLTRHAYHSADPSPSISSPTAQRSADHAGGAVAVPALGRLLQPVAVLGDLVEDDQVVVADALWVLYVWAGECSVNHVNT